MKPDWDHLIESGQAEELARLVGAWLEVELPAKAFLAACQDARSRIRPPLGNQGLGSRAYSWSDCTWRCWFSYRVAEFRQGVPGCPKDVRWSGNSLHIAFLSIEETEEHLENLRRVAEPAKDDAPARSKIGSTERLIEPIDAVAGRVVPEKR